jgi:hypothetical protein
MLFVVLAVLFIVISLLIEEEEAFWKILFVVISASLWFILALSNLNIETPYTFYNSTSGNTEMNYSAYIDESSIYYSYFFGMMGCLCIIYLVVLIFGAYYKYIDDKENGLVP